MSNPRKFSAPRNQKELYDSFAQTFDALANDEITPDKGFAMCKALSGMNTAFAQEVRLKIASGKVDARPSIESTAFDDTTQC